MKMMDQGLLWTMKPFVERILSQKQPNIENPKEQMDEKREQQFIEFLCVRLCVK